LKISTCSVTAAPLAAAPAFTQFINAVPSPAFRAAATSAMSITPVSFAVSCR
jgi:hypothetical protein